MELTTIINHYRMRRVRCRRRGVRVEQVPWANGKHQLGKAYRQLLAHWDRKPSWKEVAESRKMVQQLTQCSPQERTNYIEAVEATRTGRIRVQTDDGGESGTEGILTLASVQVATGEPD